MRRVAIVCLVLIVAAVLAYWAYIAQQETASAHFPATADRTVELSSSVEHANLGELTASSDLVVEGTILGAAPGGTWTFASDSGIPASGQVDRLLRIRVDRTVYAAEGVVAPAEVFVLEGVWEAGVGIQNADMPWSKPGQRGYFYLIDYTEYGDAETFNYVAPTGRVLVDGGEAQASGHHQPVWEQVRHAADSPSGHLDRSSVEELIVDAARQARSGDARRVVPPRPDACPETASCPQFTP